jgi:hypothetical protein
VPTCSSHTSAANTDKEATSVDTTPEDNDTDATPAPVDDAEPTAANGDELAPLDDQAEPEPTPVPAHRHRFTRTVIGGRWPHNTACAVIGCKARAWRRPA